MSPLEPRSVPTKIDKLNDKVYKVDYGDERFVKIGSETHNKFKPHLFFDHWNGECYFNVIPRGNYEINNPSETSAGIDITKVQINEDSGDEAISFYPVEDDDWQEDGGFEFETILLKKPKTNEIIYDFDCGPNLRFYYQPPYNKCIQSEDEKKLVVTRTETTGYDKDNKVIFSMPEKAIGSYAVYRRNTPRFYHDKSSDIKYKAGKIFHIWRPKIIDADENWVWGDLYLNDDEKYIKITIPQSFLNGAHYPVKVDPTFGYTTLGSGGYTIENLKNGYVGNPGATAEVSSLHAGLDSNWDSGDHVKMALYTNESTGYLQSPQTVELSTGHGAAAFVQFNPTSGTISVSDQEYVVVAWADADVTLRCDYSGDTGDSRFHSGTYGSWPASLLWSDWAWSFSTYATYSTAATPTITNASDEDFHPDEEDIDVDGANFGSSQGTGDIELGDASTYSGSSTLVSQTVNSWSDTQINIDIAIGAHDEGTLYLYVTNDDGGTNETGYAVSVTTPSPTISDAGDENFYDGEENIIVDGTDFGYPQKSGKIEIGNANTYIGSTIKQQQTVNSWSDTQLDIDIVKGSLSLGNNWLYVTHDSGDVSDGYAITLSAAPTQEVFDIPGSDTFTVPAGVTQIEVFMWAGGGGGAGGGTSSVGGDGAGSGYVHGRFSVSPSDELDLYVGGGGGEGDFGGSYSGDGGGGGGKSWIADAEDTWMMVAAGGGGGGGGDNSSSTAGGDGGEGGSSTGANGGASGNAGGGSGGSGTTGGVGGVNSGTGSDGYDGNNYGESPSGAGGNGGEGNVGPGGSAANAGISDGGDGGEGDYAAGFGGGGGGGEGGAGGGGGAGSASGNAGGGGGGGGSNYINISLVSDRVNQQATDQTPYGTGLPEYSAGVGVGGDGGATSGSGTAGGDGRIVIKWSYGWPHNYKGIENSSLGKINGVSLSSIGKVNGVE